LSGDEQNLQTIDNEISLEYLSRYLKRALSNEDIVRIPEDEREYSMGSSSMRSPSIGSTNSSQASIFIDLLSENCPFVPLHMRFPKSEWKLCLEIYEKFK